MLNEGEACRLIHCMHDIDEDGEVLFNSKATRTLV